MEAQQVPANLEIAHRLRRSKGRAGRSVVASTKLTPDEQDELDRAAKSAGKAFSEWAREILLTAARSNGEQLAVITELVAMRMLLSTVLRPVALGERLTHDAYVQVLNEVRTGKHDTAREVLRQYRTIDLEQQP